MAEAQTHKTPSLSEDYLLEKEEKQEVTTKPVDVKEVENPATAPVEVASDKVDEPTATAAAAEESSETTGEENSGDKEALEETPEIKLETAPADFRFPTTNQTRYCFTRYIEYHRCVAAKGEGALECDKFAKYYRVNGLTNGTSKGKMEPFQVLCRWRCFYEHGCGLHPAVKLKLILRI